MSNPTATAYLADLHARGVRLTQTGDKLHVDAPLGILGDEDRRALAELKTELLLAVTSDASQTTEPHGDLADTVLATAEVLGWPALTLPDGRRCAGPERYRLFVASATPDELDSILVALHPSAPHDPASQGPGAGGDSWPAAAVAIAVRVVVGSPKARRSR